MFSDIYMVDDVTKLIGWDGMRVIVFFIYNALMGKIHYINKNLNF